MSAAGYKQALSWNGGARALPLSVRPPTSTASP